MERTILITDIHGCFPELIALLDKVEFDERYDRLVCLGDMIDRGMYSYECYRFFCGLKNRMRQRLVLLRGNHEDMYRKTYMGDSHWSEVWSYNGREATERSFLAHHTDPLDSRVYEWFEENLVPYYVGEGFQCVHAGLVYPDPEKNPEKELYWNRDIEKGLYNGKLTIVGHTPVYDPTWIHDHAEKSLPVGEWFDLPDHGMIDIDTGGVFRMKFTAMIIEGSRCRLETTFWGKDMPDPDRIRKPFLQNKNKGEKSLGGTVIYENLKSSKKEHISNAASGNPTGARELLKKGTVLHLMKYGTRNETSFHVTSDIPEGMGGSCVCYRAKTNENSGLLKEFYPAEMAEDRQLIRDSAGFLRPVGNRSGGIKKKDSAAEKLKKLREHYRQSVEKYNELLTKNEDMRLLNSYISLSEIYVDQADNLYIWNPNNPLGKVFDDQIREWGEEKPIRDPKKRVYQILATVCSMAKCISIFHDSDVLHLDIKPQNFLITYDVKRHLNPSHVMLFDLDTIHALEWGTPPRVGTPGFMDPQVMSGEADASAASDQYSLGATLYYALCGKDGKSMVYEEGSDIKKALKESDLYQALAKTERKLFLKLSQILERSLAGESVNRYDSVAGFLLALENVRDEFNVVVNTGVLLDPALKQILMEAMEEINPVTVIQNLLYRYPLYQWTLPRQEQINVLILGDDSYTRTMIDQVLQAFQVCDRQICITVAANDAVEACKAYLKNRPAIKYFVDIRVEDESVSDGEENPYRSIGSTYPPYGTVCFRTISQWSAEGFVEGNEDVNTEAMYDILERSLKGMDFFSTVFISLGTDRLNDEIAELADGLFREDSTGDEGYHYSYSIHPIHSGEAETVSEHIHPVNIQQVRKPEDMIDETLFARAFSAHCIWNSDVQNDPDQLKLRFLDKANNGYNFNSSLAFALSISYKLWSLGIDVAGGPETVEQFEKLLAEYASPVDGKDAAVSAEAQAEAQRKLMMMTALEHRRWNLEKLCDGYQGMLDTEKQSLAEQCADLRKNRNASEKKHSCILFSDETMPLTILQEKVEAGLLTEEDYFKVWNEIPLDELQRNLALDDLDTMSIKLHRDLYRFNYRKVYKRKNPWKSSLSVLEEYRDELSCDYDELKKQIGSLSDTMEILVQEEPAEDETAERIRLAMAKREANRKLQECLEALKAEIDKLAEPMIREDLKDSLTKLEKILYPMIQGNKYADYKQNDWDLVKGLTKILK